jgi:hypothetical protein
MGFIGKDVASAFGNQVVAVVAVVHKVFLE